MSDLSYREARDDRLRRLLVAPENGDDWSFSEAQAAAEIARVRMIVTSEGFAEAMRSLARAARKMVDALAGLAVRLAAMLDAPKPELPPWRASPPPLALKRIGPAPRMQVSPAMRHRPRDGLRGRR